MNSHQAGILKWILGDRSQNTFCYLWSVIKGWRCFLYITDGWKVYPCFIDDCDRLGENSRLRHYLARRHSLGF